MNRFITQYIRGAEWLNYFIFLLVVCSLPFPWHFTQPLIVAWGISWLLEGRWLQKRYLRFNRTQIPMLLITVFIAWEALSLMWTDDAGNGIRQFGKHLPVLAVIMPALFGVNKRYRMEKIQIVLYAATLVSVFAYLLLLYWARVNNLMDFYVLYARWDFWNLFNIPPVSNIMHHAYYCPIILLALGCSGSLYRHFRQTYPRWSVLLTLGTGDLILLGTIFLSGTRIALLLLPVILLVAGWRYRHHRYIKRIGIAIVLLIGITGSVFWTQSTVTPKIKQAFQWVSYEDSKYQPLAREPRIYIWHIVLHEVSDYGWKGMGLGSADAYLDRAYRQDGMPEIIDLSFNPHNQYLQTWMELGPLAMLLLVLIVFSAPCFHSQHVRWTSIYICLIYGWSMLTECYFSRMSGVFQLCFVAVLLIAMEQAAAQPRETEDEKCKPMAE
ncbi:MAG: O-antigen ligase family protein [Paludibacteraceae bacterium]|nr:O-antigen ligase family protein [Paludibacteraceae bacterium]